MSDPVSAGFHLAQINVGRLRHPMEAPETAGFTDELDRINALAEASPGFVWRLTGDDGSSSSFVEVPGHEHPLDVVNYSIWTDVESLRAYTFGTEHVEFLRRRREWFEPPQQNHLACWWIPAGTVPDVAEAARRLEHLRSNGPSAEAFSLTRPEPPPATPG